MDKIERHNIPTAGGNTLAIFYNPGNNLLVIDLMADGGGNEIVRQILDEEELLSHLDGVRWTNEGKTL